jgi:N-acetyl-alpha-D-muramate 1-phosphate uridylyltransferase
MSDDRPRAAMILAAGRGERMRPLTDTIPKPLLQVHGKALIERHIECLVKTGIQSIVINLAWLGEKIREQLGDGSRYGARIAYSEEDKALETAGGIIQALPLLGDGPFLIVNGDVLSGYPLGELRIGAAFDAQLVLVPNPPQHPHGDFGLLEGRVVRRDQERHTFSGIALYRAQFFAGFAPGYGRLMPLWQRSIAAGRCGGELYRGFWEDVGTPERLAALNR